MMYMCHMFTFYQYAKSLARHSSRTHIDKQTASAYVTNAGCTLLMIESPTKKSSGSRSQYKRLATLINKLLIWGFEH